MAVSLRCPHLQIYLAKLRALGGERMQSGEEPRDEDAINEIAALLAAAYKRRASIRLVHTPPESVPSTEELANASQTSRHELKLTSQRKESTQR
jgi:hypothetical protein